MINQDYFFYMLPANVWKHYEQRLPALLLECQPYHTNRFYKIATMKVVEDLQEFACEDKGRTNGWFQCFLGTGIYRKDSGKIKLSSETKDFIANIPTGTVTLEGDTWAEIMNGYVQKLNLATQENKET